MPRVIGAERFLHDPGSHLRSLCTSLGIAFSERMLHWPAGPRSSDGVGSPHWYAAVCRSTGFEPTRARQVQLDGHAAKVAEACRGNYEKLLAYATPGSADP